MIKENALLGVKRAEAYGSRVTYRNETASSQAFISSII